MAPSTLGFSYSEASSSGNPLPLTNIIQFQPNHSQEMIDMVGFHLNHHFIKSQDHWNNTNIPHQNQNRFLGEEDPSLSFVPPNDQRPRPIQGRALSLTLSSSSNPSCIKLQSFEFRPPDESRFDPSSSASVNYQHEQPQTIQQGLLQMRNSRYLSSAQELVNEFCSLDVMKKRPGKGICEENNEEDAMGKQSLYALDRLQLQRRRTKLLHMLEEVNRRYRHYCNRMKGVVSSLETAAGEGAAAVYTSMALRAMSRHFRCLKDGILKQIKVSKKAMGYKDGAGVPGAIKGETPRLRILDQSLRQQRAFQQSSITESHPWRPQRGLPERSVSVLRSWLFEHFLHPYPSDVDKHILARQTGLSKSQVSNWFINARVRLWKPMVEEMYLQDLKETQPTATATGDHPGPRPLDQNNTSHPIIPDQKPSLEHLIGVVAEPDTLSSIIANNNSSTHNTHHRFITSPILIDQYGATVQSGFGDVSLTLGLHQHGVGGLGLGSYSHPAEETAENPNFYTRDVMEDCQTVQYSLMESENQNLPYRNLMGAQLLRDLAG